MQNLTRIPARCKAVLLSAVVFLGAESAAQNTTQGTGSDLATSQDCAEILLQDLDNAALTQEEKIALLEKALLRSLNNFDPCQSAVSDATGGAAGGGGGGAQGTEGSPGAEQAAVDSKPAGDIQGDQPAFQEPRDEQGAGAEETIADNKTDPISGDSMPPNGNLPEDIPPAENDDIIAQQFRRAALDETDPVARAKLWNEYRRYKNLPVQDAPET